MHIATRIIQETISYPKQLSWRWVPPSELATPSKFRDSIGPGAAILSQRIVGERERGKKTAAAAVELSFSLETNSYCFATVLLREIMKQ